MGRGVVEGAVHPARHIERDVLVRATVVHTLPVLVLQEKGLAAEVHLHEPLARSGKTLVGLALKRERGAVVAALGLAISNGQGIVARRREVVVGGQAHLVFTVGEESDVDRFLRCGLQVAPEIDVGRCLHDVHALHAVFCAGVIVPVRQRLGKQLQRSFPDSLCILQHVVFVHWRGVVTMFKVDEDPQDVRLVVPDDHRIGLVLSRRVGSHVVRQCLSAERDTHTDVTIACKDSVWPAGFPQALLAFQLRIEVEEVEQMVVCWFHIYILISCCLSSGVFGVTVYGSFFGFAFGPLLRITIFGPGLL